MTDDVMLEPDDYPERQFAETPRDPLAAAEQRGYERRLAEENRVRETANAPRDDEPEPSGYGAMHTEADAERAEVIVERLARKRSDHD